MIYFILFFIGLLIGCAPCAYLLHKLQIKVQQDQSLICQEQELKSQIEELKLERIQSEDALDKINEEVAKKEGQLEAFETQSKVALDAIYEKNYTLMENALSRSAELLQKQYQEEEESYKQEYLNTLQTLVDNFSAQVEEKKVEISDAEEILENLRLKVAAAVAADKRALEIKEKENFYKLNLSIEDLHEIAKLRQVVPHLKSPEALNKVIWKCYYEKPTSDLIGRVIGSGVHVGIYKITNLVNHMTYVGQSNNLAERWRQHIKRGLGADTPTRNKLYPAMIEYGVENFSFEVIEECSPAQLNEREQYWQQFFEAKTFGYSIK